MNGLDAIEQLMAGKEQIVIFSDGLLVRAPAKINLTLLIAGKRPDGFHEIETIMAKVDYFDEVLIQQGQKPGIEVVSEGSYWAPQGRENLIYKACELLLNSGGSKADIKITLTKNIPAGSGLGSASSDAAATLLGVNQSLELGVSREELSKLAAELGSDVVFFLNGPLAFCTGKGEKITEIKKNFDFLALLLLPDISVSTKAVYTNYNHNHNFYKQLSRQIEGYIRKNRIDLASKMCANILQTSCFHLHNELNELKSKIESLGIGPLCLSGSGSAMFCVFGSGAEKEARECQNKIEKKIDCKSVIVRNNRW